eukprot:349953_1
MNGNGKKRKLTGNYSYEDQHIHHSKRQKINQSQSTTNIGSSIYTNIQTRTTLHSLLYLLSYYDYYKELDNEGNEFISFNYRCKKRIQDLLLNVNNNNSYAILKKYLLANIINDNNKIIKLYVDKKIIRSSINGLYLND